MTSQRPNPGPSWLRDDLADVLLDLSARRARTMLLLISVALSTGVLTAATAINTSAARQVDADLAAAATTTMTVTVKESHMATPPDEHWFPPDTDIRATRLPLVLAAGRRLDLAAEDHPVTRLATTNPRARTVATAACVTAGYLHAAAATTTTPTDLLDSPHPPRVVILGVEAAHQLGIEPDTSGPGVQVWIGGQDYTVIGHLTSSPQTNLDPHVLLPYQHCLTLPRVTDAQTTVLVRTAPGGGAPVADAIRTAIRPDQPAALQTSQVIDFTTLRTGVSSNLARLATGIGALLLALTTLLITNSMIVSVITRTPEIGLRRALGASRTAIARLFLIEGALIGIVGALAGTALGALAALTVTALNNWTTDIPTWLYAFTPTLGLIIGITATTHPATRAANTQPAEAIQTQ